MTTTETVIITLVILAVLVIILAYAVMQRRRRSGELRTSFGPEYERTVAEQGDRKAAEANLLDRQDRRSQLQIRELDGMRRQQYSAQWEQVQSRFVDQPVSAAAEADQLIRELMAERGYPTDDVDSQADLVSVDHPELVGQYREAISRTQAGQAGEATTEELRAAMVCYRSLFARLLETDGAAQTGEPR